MYEHTELKTNKQVRVLVVKQNWLLEYLPNETRAPVGFIHLEVITDPTRA